MGLRSGLVKTELKAVRAAYDKNIPPVKVAKRHRCKVAVINKCYKHFSKQDEEATKIDPAGDNEEKDFV